MPYISMFFGIIIRMFYNEHGLPHFHAEYQGQKGSFDINGDMIRGSMKSRRAKKLIKEWAELHKSELVKNWNNGKTGEQHNKIAPLD